MIKFMKTNSTCLLLCLFLTGCVSSPPTNFYSLQPQGLYKDQVQALAIQKNLTIGIGPLEIPELLDRTQIVTKQSGHQVKLAEFHQWGEPLDSNILRVLSQNMAALRGNDVIRSYPWAAFGSVDYRIIIKFLRFDSTPGQTATLEADWSIVNEHNHQVLKNGHSKIDQTVDDQSYQAVVDALSKTLVVLSKELSNSLNDLLSLSNA